MVVKVGLVSLGCPKNLVDSENMLGLLVNSGLEITSLEHEADVLVVNTCSFIKAAKEESIKTIFELAQHKIKGKCRVLLVAGCLAQRYPEELLGEIPEVDGLIGTGSISGIVEAVNRVLRGDRTSLVGAPGYIGAAGLPRIQATPFYTAYLKIAEGCDNCCNYCTIPKVRGPFRSRRKGDILDEAVVLAARGVKELILVAQDTTRYGADLYGKPQLADLIKRLAAVEGLEWIRLLYTYPALLDDEIIQLMASENKLCRYLDIPLQHASDSVLKGMNRRGSRKDIISLVQKVRTTVPGVTLRTSFIVGFPGESEDNFQDLLNFMAEVKFDKVGIFPYSREEGTVAAEMPGQVDEETKLERRERAMALQQKISQDKNLKRIGDRIHVLVEGKSGKKGLYYARSEGDAPDIDGRVFFKSNLALQPGEFVNVLINGAGEYDLTGELLQ